MQLSLYSLTRLLTSLVKETTDKTGLSLWLLTLIHALVVGGTIIISSILMTCFKAEKC